MSDFKGCPKCKPRRKARRCSSSRSEHMLQDQPPPTPGDGDVWQAAIEYARATLPLPPALFALMCERRLLGIERYGTPLQLRNGRVTLVDGMQEALDGFVYAMQAHLEQRTTRVLPTVWLYVLQAQYAALHAQAVAEPAVHDVGNG